MLKLIIVPLDGSGFGEQALPTAASAQNRQTVLAAIDRLLAGVLR